MDTLLDCKQKYNTNVIVAASKNFPNISHHLVILIITIKLDLSNLSNLITLLLYYFVIADDYDGVKLRKVSHGSFNLIKILALHW